ncbi:MAG: BtpA/SgcQ family protein [Planctomycetota bacterium]
MPVPIDLFREASAAKPVLIGMVHVGALPGTPGSETSIEVLAAQAANEACVLERAGFDAIIVENMHDRPYVHKGHGPEIVAAMTRVALEIEGVCQLPMGVQILSGGAAEALAVCAAADGAFIRCENFVFSHVADEGLLERAEAGDLLRYRRNIDATHIGILADIKKKHASHAITSDVSLEEAAEAAEFFGADGLIVTGAATGKPTSPEDIAQVRAATSLPVVVGSGVTPDNAGAMAKHAHALIVGSAIKHDGLWSKEVDPARCVAMAQAVR